MPLIWIWVTHTWTLLMELLYLLKFFVQNMPIWELMKTFELDWEIVVITYLWFRVVLIISSCSNDHTWTHSLLFSFSLGEPFRLLRLFHFILILQFQKYWKGKNPVSKFNNYFWAFIVYLSEIQKNNPRIPNNWEVFLLNRILRRMRRFSITSLSYQGILIL
jgi:hypothetical protein